MKRLIFTMLLIPLIGLVSCKQEFAELPQPTFLAMMPAQKALLAIVDKTSKESENVTLKSISEEIHSLEELRATNTANYKNISRKLGLAYANYYNKKYPGYKFVLNEDLTNLLSEHHLAISKFSEYTGQVPEPQLNNIIKFQPRETFVILREESTPDSSAIALGLPSFPRTSMVVEKIIDNKVNTDDMTERSEKWFGMQMSNGGTITYHSFHYESNEIPLPAENGQSVTKYEKSDNLFIIADSSELKSLMSVEQTNHKKVLALAPKDPIVLLKLNYGFLVITAWGPEAELIKP